MFSADSELTEEVTLYETYHVILTQTCAWII